MRSIAIASVLIFVASSVAAAVAAPPAQARSYIEGLGFAVKGEPQCSSTDSDGDGYVSCTVRLNEPMRDGTELMQIECGSGWERDGCGEWRPGGIQGCKEKLAKTNVTVNRD